MMRSAGLHVLAVAASDFSEGQFGGISSFIRDFQKAASADPSIRVTVMGLPRHPTLVSEIGARSQPDAFVSLTMPPFTSKRLSLATAIFNSGKQLRDLGASVHYAHSPEIAVALSMACPETPIVFHAHGIHSTLKAAKSNIARSWIARYAFKKFFERPAIARARRILVTADENDFGLFVNAQPRETRRKIRRIPSMVNDEIFTPRPTHPEGCGQNVAFAGRLVRSKRVDVLIGAVAMIRRGGSNISLTIIGDGPERERLARLATALGIGEAVRFTGYLPAEGVAEELRRASIYATASMQEGISVALLEALATGLPVVAAEAGGVGDLITQDRTGFVVREPGRDGLADGIQRALNTRVGPVEVFRRTIAPYRTAVVSGRVIAELTEVAA